MNTQPVNMMMAFVTATEAKKRLESKGYIVADDFVMRNSLLTAAINNPLLGALMLNNDIQAIDSAISPVAQAEIDKAKEEAEQFKLGLNETWVAFKEFFCLGTRTDVAASRDAGTISVTIKVPEEWRHIFNEPSGDRLILMRLYQILFGPDLAEFVPVVDCQEARTTMTTKKGAVN